MSAHPLRFAVSLQNDRPIAETVEHARLAEALGYREIWTNENGHYRGVFRALLRGDPVPASEQFTVSTRARLDFEPVRRDLPVYAGAVNERMLRAAGAYADSVELGAIMSTGYVRWALGVIGDGATAAGRDPASQDIAAPLMVSVGADAKAAREAVKPGLAYYLHRVERVVYAHSGADADASSASVRSPPSGARRPAGPS